MVEKIKLTQDILNRGRSLEERGLKLIDEPLPYSEIETAALEFMEAVYIIDPLGVVYENYSYDLEWVYIILKYFTNLDIEGWDKETLFQHFTIDTRNFNVNRFDAMVDRMVNILKKRVERENSLDYKLGQLVDSLKDMNVQQTNETTEKIISLMDRVNEAEKKPVLTMFAKKD